MDLSASVILQYETFLESLKLNPALYKIKDVEMDLRGGLNPSIHLEQLFFNENKWLGFEDFFEWYCQKNILLIRDQIQQSKEAAFKDGLRARLYRTQFGFLTEYHAYFLSQMVFSKENVWRGSSMDVAGVDFRIRFQQTWYNIHIFVDTGRAWQYRLYKSQHKNVEKIPGIHVNLPYSLQAGRFNSLRFLKNKFGVYTLSYLDHLRKEIVAGNIKNNNIIGTSADNFLYKDNLNST